MILKRDEAFKAVCEFLTPRDDGTFDVGTAMFVSSPAGEDKVLCWIVTASHVAKTTNEKTILVESNVDGKALMLPLKLFGELSEWKHHLVADISCLKINPTQLNISFIKGHMFPYDHFDVSRECVSRDTELTCIGFPNGLGTSGSFSPFTFRSFASSGFITHNRADTKTPSEFFCLEHPSVGGYSGCPVFDLGYSVTGLITQTKDKTRCHGIMHGTMSDNTGGKIAIVTPAFYLSDIIISINKADSKDDMQPPSISASYQ